MCTAHGFFVDQSHDRIAVRRGPCGNLLHSGLIQLAGLYITHSQVLIQAYSLKPQGSGVETYVHVGFGRIARIATRAHGQQTAQSVGRRGRAAAGKLARASQERTL
jgi:hypothetical protein